MVPFLAFLKSCVLVVCPYDDFIKMTERLSTQVRELKNLDGGIFKPSIIFNNVLTLGSRSPFSIRIKTLLLIPLLRESLYMLHPFASRSLLICFPISLLLYLRSALSVDM